MASLTQLHLFEQNDEISLLKREIVILKKNQEKFKREMLARHNELANLCVALKEEMDLMRCESVKDRNSANEHKKLDKVEDPYESLFREAYLGSRSTE